MTSFLITTAWLLLFWLIFYYFVFLRDNKNRIPAGENIVAPASGKIVFLEKIIPEKIEVEIRKGFFGQIQTTFPMQEEYYLVNIFMNVLNVHYTKAPCDGLVQEIVHCSGKFRATMTMQNVVENEKQEFVLTTSYGLMKVIQIAGLLARRCVAFARVHDTVDKGAKLGQIRMGSQVALLIPSKNLVPQVQVDDHVSAGETILFLPKSS